MQHNEDLQSNRAGAVDLMSTLYLGGGGGGGGSLKANSSLVPWTECCTETNCMGS